MASVRGARSDPTHRPRLGDVLHPFPRTVPLSTVWACCGFASVTGKMQTWWMADCANCRLRPGDLAAQMLPGAESHTYILTPPHHLSRPHLSASPAKYPSRDLTHAIFSFSGRGRVTVKVAWASCELYFTTALLYTRGTSHRAYRLYSRCRRQRLHFPRSALWLSPSPACQDLQALLTFPPCRQALPF